MIHSSRLRRGRPDERGLPSGQRRGDDVCIRRARPLSRRLPRQLGDPRDRPQPAASRLAGTLAPHRVAPGHAVGWTLRVAGFDRDIVVESLDVARGADSQTADARRGGRDPVSPAAAAVRVRDPGSVRLRTSGGRGSPSAISEPPRCSIPRSFLLVGAFVLPAGRTRVTDGRFGRRPPRYPDGMSEATQGDDRHAWESEYASLEEDLRTRPLEALPELLDLVERMLAAAGICRAGAGCDTRAGRRRGARARGRGDPAVRGRPPGR